LPWWTFCVSLLVIMLAGIVARMRRSMIEVDVDQLTLSYRTILHTSRSKTWPAGDIIAVKVQKAAVSMRLRSANEDVGLATFPTPLEAESAAEEIRLALGHPPPGTFPGLI
jgi:hypothetical protein